MSKEKTFQVISNEQIKALEAQGCCAEDWKQVEVADGFISERIRNTCFMGLVRIGGVGGTAESVHGIQKPCGIYNATILNCNIGDGVRIANVGVHIANYDIEDGVCIEDVGTIQANAGAAFGNGIRVETVNEAGGR